MEEFEKAALPGVVLVRPQIFHDDRGGFLEVYHRRRFVEAGITLPFVQDNLSRSHVGVLRGLHYQIQHPQGKLITCLTGEIFDVVVDLRKNSDHFGKWFGARLSGERCEGLYVPPGFAHGFCVLSESADVLYKCTDIYHPESERTLLWNDPAVGIEWPLKGNPILSRKDQSGQLLSAAECFE